MNSRRNGEPYDWMCKTAKYAEGSSDVPPGYYKCSRRGIKTGCIQCRLPNEGIRYGNQCMFFGLGFKTGHETTDMYRPYERWYGSIKVKQ